ncbi:MAG: hypothetical protein ACHQNT_04215 [Bacteroidia bacterium]
MQIEQPTKDSVTYHKVMLIPFDPLFYLSDAENDIAVSTKKNPPATRDNFRMNIDYQVKRAIGRHRPCIAMLSDLDSMPSLKEALISVYSTTGYRYDKPMPIPFKREITDSTSGKKNKTDKELLDSKIAAQYLITKGEAQYMNAIVSKPSVLDELYNQYETDIFVFINQFEIKTNYSQCLDIANKIYQREVMLHFSIYDKNGKQLAGAYASSFFPSNSNNAFDIMKNCFPELAKFIAMCTP